jgi:hypothetical protein
MQLPSSSQSSPLRRCRHCAGTTLEDCAATYSSVLITGGERAMKTMVESLEERIIPCVTAVCPACDRVSLISDGSTESMLCSIYMWQRLREWIDTKYEAERVEQGAVPARVVATAAAEVVKKEEPPCEGAPVRPLLLSIASKRQP